MRTVLLETFCIQALQTLSLKQRNVFSFLDPSPFQTLMLANVVQWAVRPQCLPAKKTQKLVFYCSEDN